MKRRKFTTRLLIMAIAALPPLSMADSQLSIGGVGTTAQANLDFRIVIPSFIFFQVGSALTVDRVDYDLNVGPIQPGAGAPVTATGGLNDGADGNLSIILATNAASVSIAATGGNLTDGGTNNIPFTDITATDTGTIPVPDFGTTITPFAPGGFSLADTWSYVYDNTTVYAAATYNGTVTYTVTVL